MKTIQIKNAQKIFRKHYFKMMGHDFLRVYDDVKNKMSLKEKIAFAQYDQNLSDKYGDYEVIVQVVPGKIKITLLEEFD